MRIIKDYYKYYEIVGESAKFYKVRELEPKLLKSEHGNFKYGEGTKCTKLYESGVYYEYERERKFSKVKYQGKVEEVSNKYEIDDVSYNW